MPYVTVNESPLAESQPARIYYREFGKGFPLVFLHGGWGYEIYPFDRQVEAFAGRFRILIPDRSGYGRSGRIRKQPADFHHRAAVEVVSFLDALEIERPILWGHSDGAVIAALLGLRLPERFAGLIFEAFHYFRAKPQSREFFETMASDPGRLGERVCRTLARQHGEDYWEEMMALNGRAWLAIADESSHPLDDLYGGRLSQLTVPAVFLHGSRDPRTEPGELAAVRQQLPRVPLHVMEGAGHSPHSESAFAEECNRLAGDFFK